METRKAVLSMLFAIRDNTKSAWESRLSGSRALKVSKVGGRREPLSCCELRESKSRNDTKKELIKANTREKNEKSRGDGLWTLLLEQRRLKSERVAGSGNSERWGQAGSQSKWNEVNENLKEKDIKITLFPNLYRTFSSKPTQHGIWWALILARPTLATGKSGAMGSDRNGGRVYTPSISMGSSMKYTQCFRF